MRHHPSEKRDVRFHTANSKFPQCAFHAVDGIHKTPPASGHFGQQRIVEWVDDRTAERTAGVEADSHAPGRTVMRDSPIVRHEVVGRVFGRDTTLHGEAAEIYVFLITKPDVFVREFHSLSHQDLTFHNVDIGDLLGHRMFYLNPRVDLNEVELLCFDVDQELHGSGAGVVDGFSDFQGGVQNAVPQCCAEIRGRSQLHDFLVTPLHGAVTFIQMHQIAMLIAQQLNFDMLCPADELFQKDFRTAERGSRFVSSRLKGLIKLGCRAHRPHAATATTFGRLDHHRKTNLFGALTSLFHCFDGFGSAPQNRNTSGHGDVTRCSLVTQRFKAVHRGTNELDPRFGTGSSKLGTLRQKTISGVNRIRAHLLSQRDDGRDVQVRPNRFARLANSISLIRFKAMQSVTVFVRINRDRPDPQFCGTAKNTDRNF